MPTYWVFCLQLFQVEKGEAMAPEQKPPSLQSNAFTTQLGAREKGGPNVNSQCLTCNSPFSVLQ